MDKNSIEVASRARKKKIAQPMHDFFLIYAYL